MISGTMGVEHGVRKWAERAGLDVFVCEIRDPTTQDPLEDFFDQLLGEVREFECDFCVMSPTSDTFHGREEGR